MNAELSDLCVLISGASGGIGQATARGLAAEGARLVLHCHRQRAAAEQLLQSVDAPSVVVQADLSDEAQVDRMFADALATFPRIDALIVNAGIWVGDPAPLHRMSLI